MSTLRFWVKGTARRRGSGFEGTLERNLGVLAAEDDFFRPSSKANGEGWAVYCNMREEERRGLVDNRRRLAQEERKARWCICSDGDLLRV